MAITDDLRKTLSDPTPLYALAGAGDLAVEKLREVPEKAAALAGDRKAAQEKATARLHEAQTKLTEAQTKLTETVSGLPTDIKQIQEKAQGFALQQVGRAAEFAVKAREVYDELAERGKGVVERGRKEAAGEISAAGDAFAEATDKVSDQVQPKPEQESGSAATKAEAKPAAKPAAKRSTPRKTTAAKPSSTES